MDTDTSGAFRENDPEWVVARHARPYASEYGFDAIFAECARAAACAICACAGSLAGEMAAVTTHDQALMEIVWARDV